MTNLRHLRLPVSVLTILLAGLTAAFAATGLCHWHRAAATRRPRVRCELRAG